MLTTIACGSAEELLRQLSPACTDLWGSEPRDWIFRGQRDATWQLVPSAHRAGAWTDIEGPTACSTSSGAVQREARVLRRFAQLANVQGLTTPAEPRECVPRENEAWLPERLYAHAALAQHYGVPTRLLDWTRRPLVAAWFAAEGAVRSVDSTSHLAVWALRRSFNREQHPLQQVGVTVVYAPRASNPNLHLQSGLFTHSCESEPLETRLASTQDLLRKLTLPQTQAGRLLKLLANSFVQGATVYAGYEGVIRSMKEERYRQP